MNAPVPLGWKEQKGRKEHKEQKESKKVVIIGGGFAGALIARKLQSLSQSPFQVTFIDEKEYFEFTPSVLRTLTEPQHAKKIQVLHAAYLPRARIIQGTVSTITPTMVRVRQQNILFDILVIASGSRYNTPIKEKNLVLASRTREFQQYAQKLVYAQTILIIGGGIVGVELAAEIVLHFPGKQLILVHSKEKLMERTPLKAQQYAQQFLQKRGVDIIFDEKVIQHHDHHYQTNKGRKISCNLAFLCTGITPNSEHLGICSSYLNEKKLLNVNEFLQVEGHSHIFAAGDITAIPEEKTAQAAEQQAAVVAENILRQYQEKPMKAYLPRQKAMVISLGKWDGIFWYHHLVFTGIIPGMLKRLIEWKTMRKYR